LPGAHLRKQVQNVAAHGMAGGLICAWHNLPGAVFPP
jgi:hypothetical protein